MQGHRRDARHGGNRVLEHQLLDAARVHEPDLAVARSRAAAVDQAMGEMRKLLPNLGSYVAEANFFDEAWREAFWGPNYARLLAVKDRYDPDGLFVVHHGVGSERWSADGFTRLP